MAAGIAQSVYRTSTSWTVRGSKPGGAEIIPAHPDQPRGTHSLQYNAYQGQFAGTKCPPGFDDYPPITVAGSSVGRAIYLPRLSTYLDMKWDNI
jgi:hypothetical protein